MPRPGLTSPQINVPKLTGQRSASSGLTDRGFASQKVAGPEWAGLASKPDSLI